jgi:Flp pilus assembly pilin Flp
MIAAGISVAIITVVQGLGTELANTFSNISSSLN